MTLHVETASAGHLMAVGILQVLRVHTQCKVESCVQQYIVYGTPVYSTPVYTVHCRHIIANVFVAEIANLAKFLYN